MLEICPTSNFYTGAIPAVSSHPAAMFRYSGVALVLGDDNPQQTGSLLSAEWRLLRDQLGFTAADLAAVESTSLSVVFAEESVRRSLAEKPSGGQTSAPGPTVR